ERGPPRMTSHLKPQLHGAALHTVVVIAIALAFLVGGFTGVGHATYDNDPAVMRPINHWALVNDPAANTQASASRAAAPAGGVPVADCITATFVAGTTAPSAVNSTVVVRDGATGAGTVLWAADFALAGAIAASAQPVQVCGLDLAGSVATAMT